jgi:hypothetical protein
MKKVLLFSLISSAFAFAGAETITGGFATDVEPVFITAGIIMVGIGAIWSIKKVIALGNKS